MNKKEMITNGEDVSLNDGEIIVLNSVSVAEKEELEKKEPEVEQPVKTEQATIEPEKKEEEDTVPTEIASESAEETSKQEEPVQIPISVPEETPNIPTAPIDLTGIITPDTPEINNTAEDTTVYPQFPSGPDAVAPISFGVNEDSTYLSNNDINQGYNGPMLSNFMGSYDNEASETTLPDGVKKALEMVQNEVIEIVKENASLRSENDELKKENNGLRTDLSKQAAEIAILKNEISGMKNSMAAAQSRILDVFGMGAMSTIKQSNFGDDQMNNDGKGMSA